MTEVTQAQKSVFVFEAPKIDGDLEAPRPQFGTPSQQFGTHYAFSHDLGTKDILVSARTATGEPIPTKTTTQDDNIVVVSRKDGYAWQLGDRILVLG